MRALVIDDSSTMRTILRLALRKNGFEVVEAKNGVDALAVLASSDPVDVMMVDWNMPEMDGLQFVSHVRGDPRYSRTKIMMVTTESGLPEMGRALEAGADEYLMKPFTPEVVSEKLHLMGL
jgi:two-component system chemotaxis response regulator CheY